MSYGAGVPPQTGVNRLEGEVGSASLQAIQPLREPVEALVYAVEVVAHGLPEVLAPAGALTPPSAATDLVAPASFPALLALLSAATPLLGVAPSSSVHVVPPLSAPAWGVLYPTIRTVPDRKPNRGSSAGQTSGVKANSAGAAAPERTTVLRPSSSSTTVQSSSSSADSCTSPTWEMMKI